jgi:xanthine/CO dehydrogenase XdhC/CoxF family maturation factor
MNELREILDAAKEVESRGCSAVLATVVRVVGSAYRRPGARMLFAGSDAVGMVSGGCLESDLAERAAAVLHSGDAQVVVYDMRSPDDIIWGLGLGCNGEVRILMERLAPGQTPEHLPFLDGCLAARRPAVVATVFAGSGLGRRVLLDAAGTVVLSLEDRDLGEAIVADARLALSERRSTVKRYDFAEAEAFIEYVAPSIALRIFGAGNDARPLVRLAKALGWQVTVADDRPAYATTERFPEADAVLQLDFGALDPRRLALDERTPAVVLTHHFLHDIELLRLLLPSAAPYVGLLGPRRRREHLLIELERRGQRPTPEQLRRLYGPVGLDIGADTPEEIALAVLAEIRTVLSGHRGGFLRDRRAPLHEGRA